MTRLPDWRRVERMAWRVLLARKITTLPVEPLSILKACRDTRVMTAREAAEELGLPQEQLERLLDGADALTMRRQHQGRPHYVVIYRNDGHPARLRFTLAHELGHRLLGHNGGDAAEEREADHFASHLLCPEPVVAHLRACCASLPLQSLAVGCYVSASCAKTVSRRPAAVEDSPLYHAVDAQLRQAAEAICAAAQQECPKRVAPKGE